MSITSNRTCLLASMVILLSSVSTSIGVGQVVSLNQLEGTWLFVEDRTEGRAVEQGGAPMSVQFSLRVEENAVVYPRPRGDERITLDGTVIEKKEEDGSVARYYGKWSDGVLEYTVERLRSGDTEPAFTLKRTFHPTSEGLLVQVITDRSTQVALYKHPEEIELPKPATATIGDLAWLSGNWIGSRGTSSVDERWTSPKGDAMLGVSQTVKNEKMTAFEFLRIVERDGGLVYIAQPGGKQPTEFVLVELVDQRAVFVNPRHDYPQRIVYELSDSGALTASIGFAKGRLQGFEFVPEAR